jgi:hypothetical protein
MTTKLIWEKRIGISLFELLTLKRITGTIERSESADFGFHDDTIQAA